MHQNINIMLVIYNFLIYRKGTSIVTTPIFFLHSGNTDATKFCTCTQDSYISSYKKFQVNSTYVFGSHIDELERNFTYWLQGVKRCLYYVAEIHCCLCAAPGGGRGNVMNFKSVQWWESMFREWRTNIHGDVH